MAMKREGEQGQNQKVGATSMADAFQAAQSEASQQAQQQREQFQARQQQARDALYELLNMSSTAGGPLTRRPVGETVVGYRDCFMEILKKQGRDKAGDFDFVILDADITGLPVSALLVCYRLKRGGQNTVAVYTAMIESGRSDLVPQQINIGGQQVEIQMTVGDLFDQYYWSVVERTVRDTLGAQQVLNVGSMVIPEEASSENELVMRDILFHITTALVEVMDEEQGRKRPVLTADIFTVPGVVPFAKVDYNSTVEKNVVGLPVRSDVSVKLQLNVKKGDNSPYDKTVDLTKVRGYIDLVYDATAPQATQANPFVWSQPQQGPQPVFFPRFVITGNDSAQDAITLEYQLLSLYAATVLRKNMAWAGVFRPNYALGGKGKKDQIDLRDIGAITYQVNLTGDPNATPARIDTKANSFTMENLYQLIAATIRDAVIFSMDVEEVGPMNWIHGTFVAASEGNPNATNAILEAANNLTNGQFARFYQGGPVAVPEYNRIHLGYYTNADGEMRDIRDIDYLALLNMIGGKDIRTVEEFMDTFDRTDIPVEIRLDRRYRILKEVLGDSMVIKGYATRITFDAKFIEALIAACESAGINVRSGNIAQEFGGLGVRGNLNAAAYAVPGVQGGFGQGPTAGHTYRPRGLGRWSW